ncbi:cytochrome B (plasmid) [Paraburkholderia graminis]|nr:cytochrome B [Paraburkholderia graminis]
MVFAWAVAFPVGVLAARYFKVVAGQDWPDELDNKTWWHWHRVLQGTGVLVMTVGCCLAVGHAQDTTGIAQMHRCIGWGLVASAWLQILTGVLRGSKGGDFPRQGETSRDIGLGGDHYDMTRRRKVFEYVHKVLGLSALLVAVAAIILGLVLADAPRWMAVVLASWWLVLTSLAIRWQRAGRCIDTYQAIWGPEPIHPGNRIPPIGFGIRRYSREGWRQSAGRMVRTRK